MIVSCRLVIFLRFWVWLLVVLLHNLLFAMLLLFVFVCLFYFVMLVVAIAVVLCYIWAASKLGCCFCVCLLVFVWLCCWLFVDFNWAFVLIVLYLMRFGALYWFCCLFVVVFTSLLICLLFVDICFMICFDLSWYSVILLVFAGLSLVIRFAGFCVCLLVSLLLSGVC